MSLAGQVLNCALMALNPHVRHCIGSVLIYLVAGSKGFAMEESGQPIRYFEQLKAVIFADAYAELPQYKVTRKLFDKNGKNQLLADAQRTLRVKDDLLDFPAGQKLLQANGICFAGTWQINGQSPYTGLLKADVELPLIVRASVSLSGTKQKHQRAFALALKLFPTTADGQQVTTENFFLMHSLGGVVTKSVYALTLDNQPELGSLPPFSKWLTAHRLEKDLEKADKAVSKGKPNARFRPVSHLATVARNGELVADPIKPYWLQARPQQELALSDHDDFRHELEVAHYPDKRLSWDIYAAPYSAGGKSAAAWRQVGSIILTESVISKSCDTKLHFAHPAIENDLPR